MQDRNKNFQELSQEWFNDNCIAGIDPIKAYKKWSGWITRRKLSDDNKYRKALRLATGFHEAVIRQYINSPDKHVSERRRQALDHISNTLGRTPPKHKSPIRLDGNLALLIDMNKIASSSYYMEIIKGLVEEAAKYHLNFSIYNVSQDNHESMVKRISHVYYPSGFVMVRLNPSDECCRILEEDNVPVVLIHADKKKYSSPPVFANVIPDQSGIREDIVKWADELKKESNSWKNKSDDEIVLIAMPTEPGDSIRSERIRNIMSAFNKYIPIYTVEDYSFRHAMDVYKSHPNAMGYICLSDEIAVGLKHLMEKDGKDYRHRVIGFDNSRLADLEEIASFDQSLDQIGKSVVGTFLDWFEKFSWSSAKEILLKVELVYPQV